MIIQALNEEFEIVHIEQTREEYRVLYCRTPKQEEYRILHFIQPGMIKKLLPLFDSLRSNTAYEDYRGCFSKQEELFAVFYKRKGDSLIRLLSAQDTTLEQRIFIGKKLLEKILLWKLPDFLIVQLLAADRILICQDEVHFAYDWDITLDDKSDMTTVNRRMVQLLHVLFQEEIENSVSVGLMELLDYLEKDMPEDFFAIYEAYSRLYDTMPQEAKEYVSSVTKIKMQAKKIILKAVEIGKIALFAAVYLAAIWLLLDGMKAEKAREQEKEGIIYENIGTLKIN